MSDRLTAEQYRDALVLVLDELRALPVGTGEDTLMELYRRIGRLSAQVETMADLSPHGTPPIYGLRGLLARRAQGALEGAERRGGEA